MHVVVVGAGEVGSYVADRLSREAHDVALIDIDAAKLKRLDEELDVLTVRGSGTHPSILAKAGIEHSELLVAVTANDEVNLISSMLAKSLGVPQTIVRIEAADLRSGPAAAVRAASGADLFIDPDAETAQEILTLFDFPGADEVAHMVGDEVLVIGARLPADAPLVGRTLGEIGTEFEPDWDFMVAAISRDDETIIPRRDHRLQTGDHVRIVAKRKAGKPLVKEHVAWKLNGLLWLWFVFAAVWAVPVSISLWPNAVLCGLGDDYASCYAATLFYQFFYSKEEE